MNVGRIKLMIPAMPLDGGASGIATYTCNMVKYLSAMKDFDTIVVGLESERELLEIGRYGYWVPVPDRFSPNMKNILWHTFALPTLVRRYKIDLLWLPAGNRRMIMKSACPAMVMSTIHDLAHFRLPEKYDVFRNFYVKQVLPTTWKKADALISVSENTRKDIEFYTNIPAQCVDVVPNGFDSEAFGEKKASDVRKRLAAYASLPSKYILYVARIEHPGKGHTLLLRAFKRMLEQHSDLPHHLVLAGKDWNGAEDVHLLIEELGLSEKVHTTGFVPEEILPYLYCGADLIAFPSLYEGFGIPILEAMASGVPVISSNRGALPEVVGGAARLFDPEDDDDFLAALEQGLLVNDYRQDAVLRGKRRAQEFSWKSSAEKTAQLFRRQLAQ